MAWIHSFAISGLAGRKREISKTLNRDTNILWGTNGCGKTSLLKILHSALQNNADSIIDLPFDRAEVTFFSLKYETHIIRTIDRKRLVAHKDDGPVWMDEDGNIVGHVASRSAFKWNTTPLTSEIKAPLDGSFVHRYLPISRTSELVSATRVQATRPGQPRLFLDEGGFDEMYAHHIQELWRRYSTTLLGKTTDIQQLGFAELARTVIEQPKGEQHDDDMIDAPRALDFVRNFFKSQNLRPPRTRLADFARHYSENPLFRRVVNDIVSFQRKVDKAREPVRIIEGLLNRLFYGDKVVHLGQQQVVVRANKSDVPLSALASGEKQLLRLLLECLSAESNSILIDEPEISLHVDWQHDLVKYLRQSNSEAQIIAATHSPEIMAELPDSKIFEL